MVLIQKLPYSLYSDEANIPRELVIKEQVNSHASTLFHYRKDESSLLSILKEELRFSFCLRNIL